MSYRTTEANARRGIKDGGKEMKRNSAIWGGIAVSLLLMAYPFLSAPGAFPGVARVLVRLAFSAALSASLILLGVVEEREAPAELLPAAVFGTALLLYRVGSQMTALPAQQWVWRDAAALGIVLMTLCWAQMLRAALFRRWSWRFDIKRAVFWFALVTLAIAHPYVQKEIAAIRPKADAMGGVFLVGMDVLCGAFLIPFLRKHRAGGMLLAVWGALLLALYPLLYHTPLFLNEGMSSMRALLSLLAESRNQSLFVALLLGGLWCVLPEREPRKAPER